MVSSKVVLASLFVVGGAVSLVPLFVRDKGRMSVPGSNGVATAAVSGAAPAAGSTGAALSGEALGTFGQGALGRGTLSSDERVKLYEAESAYYNAVEEMLTQRYLTSFFEEFKNKNGHPDMMSAQAAFFKEKVSVSDKEVQDFLAQNKDNPGLQKIPEDQRAAQIRGYLENQARQKVVRQVVDDARAGGQIRVAFPRPVEPRLDVTDGGNPFLGPKDAKVTIVEFADYQCPFCARMVPTLKEIVKKYDGKVRWVYRDFPLDFHDQAMPAAVAASCAGQQGKYFEMHQMLFDNMQTLGADLYKKKAAELGLDAAKFEECQKDPKVREEAMADMGEGQKFGVNGTPTYFVNGRKMGGGDVREFSRVIEEELAKM